jgi:putative transposase
VRFAFVDAEKASNTVEHLCRALRVSRAGYYAWRKRAESERAREDRRLSVLVQAAFKAGRRTYGSPRILCELRAQQVFIGRNRVIRLMRALGLRARAVKRYRSHCGAEADQPVAPNILARNFQPPGRNQSWASDTTELVTGSGKLYLAIVFDLFSRFAVGWSVSAVNDRHLVIKALDMGLRRWCPGEGLLLTLTRGTHTRARTISASSAPAAPPAA